MKKQEALTSLGKVDDGGTHQGAEDTTLSGRISMRSLTLADSVGKTGRLTLLMVKVPPAISSMVSLLSRA